MPLWPTLAEVDTIWGHEGPKPFQGLILEQCKQCILLGLGPWTCFTHSVLCLVETSSYLGSQGKTSLAAGVEGLQGQLDGILLCGDRLKNKGCC